MQCNLKCCLTPRPTESSILCIISKEFLNFLNNYQRDPRLNEILFPYATEERAVGLIMKYEPNQHLVSKQQLSADGFMWFLMSDDNIVMSPERYTSPTQD